MPVEIIYKNRRQGVDRRKSLPTEHAPERRSGLDRRKLDEKLKQLIKNDKIDPNKEKPAPTPTPSSTGTVILRKKNKELKQESHPVDFITHNERVEKE